MIKNIKKQWPIGILFLACSYFVSHLIYAILGITPNYHILIPTLTISILLTYIYDVLLGL